MTGIGAQEAGERSLWPVRGEGIVGAQHAVFT